MKSARPSSGFIEELSTAVNAEIFRGNYRRALPLVASARKRYPADVFCRYLYAKILGDWADELPTPRKKKLKREAIAILRPLLRALGGQTAKTRFGICLNYYYQSEDFRGMAKFGRRLAARRDRQGYYALGLGTSLESMRRNGKRDPRAKAWAKKSIAAWRKYDLAKEKYYFPHYVESIAYAVLGENLRGMKSLKRAAKLSRRSIEDWEFRDALELLAARAGKRV